MLSGADLDKLISDKINEVYTGYFPVAQRARLFKDTLHSEFDRLCKEPDSQMMFDKIGNYIKTEFPVCVSAKNRILLKGNTIVSITTNSTNKWDLTFDKEFDNTNDGTSAYVSIRGATGTLNIPIGLNGAFSYTKLTAYSIRVTSKATGGSPTNLGVYVANSGVAYSKETVRGETILADYKHLRAIKVCSKILTGVTAGAVVSQAPAYVLTVSNTESPTGGTIQNGDSFSVLVPNGSVYESVTYIGALYVKILTPTTWAFYTDASLTTPYNNTTSATVFPSGIYRTVCKYCTPYVSDRKISSFGVPSIYNPKFETAENYLKLYAGGNDISQAYIDYATQPVEIDLTNTTIDYSVYYNQTFLYALVDCAALEFSRMLRDGELNQYMSQEIKDNP